MIYKIKKKGAINMEVQTGIVEERKMRWIVSIDEDMRERRLKKTIMYSTEINGGGNNSRLATAPLTP